MRIYCLFEHEIPSFCLHLFSSLSEKGHTDSKRIWQNIYYEKKRRIKQNQRPWNNLRLFSSTKCCHEKKYNSMQKRKKSKKKKL